MAIKLADTLAPMSEFPAAMAEHIGFSDGATLQEKFDNEELGGGDNSVTLTQEEYEALTEEEKLDGLYYTYDTKRIYKNGIQYGASDPIPLTMEEYKALKEAGAIDEQQEYLIEAGAEGIFFNAEDIGYDNTGSSIQATTVQGAIDKVAEKVDSKTEIDDTSSSTTNTYSSAKIDEKYGSLTFASEGSTQWLKLKLGTSSNFQPITVSDQYGGKVEITGMTDDGTYKSVKLVRYSYGDWTTYSATDFTTTTDGDANYKIRRFFYYPTDGCYYLEIRQWAIIKVEGNSTAEMVASLPAETSAMTLIPESQFASKSEATKKKQVMQLPYTVSDNKFSVKYSDVLALIDKYCNFENSGVKQNAYIPLYLTCYTSNNNTLLSCFAKFEGGIYLDKVVYSSNDSSAEITRESEVNFISIELGGTITSLFIAF